MRKAYIAGSYRSATENGIYENIQKARKVAIKYWKLGYAVFCLHLNSAFMGGICDDSVWLKGDLEYLKDTDIIVMMKGWENSEGSITERLEAMKLGKKIIYER